MKSRIKLNAGESIEFASLESKGFMGKTDITKYSVLDASGSVVGFVTHTVHTVVKGFKVTNRVQHATPTELNWLTSDGDPFIHAPQGMQLLKRFLNILTILSLLYGVGILAVSAKVIATESGYDALLLALWCCATFALLGAIAGINYIVFGQPRIWHESPKDLQSPSTGKGAA